MTELENKSIEKGNVNISSEQEILARKEVGNKIKESPEIAMKLGAGLKKQLDEQMENGTKEKKDFIGEKLAGISNMLQELKDSIKPDKSEYC